MRPGAWTRSKGQYVDQLVLFITSPVDSIQQILLATREKNDSTLDKGVSLLITEEEEVASKTFEEIVHPNTEEEVAQRRFEGSCHYDRKEEFVGAFLSPRDRGSVVKATQTPMIRALPTEPAEIPSEYWRIFMEPTTSTIDFPIGDLGTGTPTKPIPLTTLTRFHGLTSKDPNTFLFEFDIVCQGYDYIMDAQKLKILPAMLKGTTL